MMHRTPAAVWRVLQGILAFTAGLSFLALPAPHSLGSPVEGNAAPGAAAAGRPAPATRAKILEIVRGLPLRFEANRGQTDPQVDFIARGSGSTVFLTQRRAVLMLRGSVTSMDGSRRAGRHGDEGLGAAVTTSPCESSSNRSRERSRWRAASEVEIR